MPFRICPTCGKSLTPRESLESRCYSCNPPLPGESEED